MKHTRAPRSKRLLWFASAMLSSGIVLLSLSLKLYSHVLIVLWLVSLVCFVISAGERLPKFPKITIRIDPAHILIFCVLLLPIMVRLLNYTPTRMHGDDLLTAYFSMEYHPRTTNFFSGIPDKDSWVSSFPTPYFLFQKLFLRVFGATLLTVKLSILPYVFFVTLLLFSSTALLTNIPTAVAAVWIYSFFAFSVYLETLGLHFISSTALFLLFFYMLLRGFRNESPRTFALAGICAAWSYLSYTSSYIAYPILFIGIFVWIIKKRRASLFRLLFWAVIGFALGIAPFATYAATSRDYFLERITQVSLINGDWSSHKHITWPETLPIVRDNLILSARSLIEPGIGGHGGYTFDRQAFFNRESLVLAGTGALLALFMGFFDVSWWLILLVLLASFVSGVVLTIPPPAFHRLSLTLPFLAMISSLPVYFITKLKRGALPFLVLMMGFLGLYAYTNLAYAKTAIQSEQLIDDASVIVYVNRMYPNRHVHIAAFPSFALEKQWRFFPNNTFASVDTDFHKNYLDRFDPHERYIYVMILPDEFRTKFIAKDPNGTYIAYSGKYGLFVNEVPEENR